MEQNPSLIAEQQQQQIELYLTEKKSCVTYDALSLSICKKRDESIINRDLMVSFKMSLNLLTKFRKKKLECYIPTYTNKLLFRILFHTYN